MESDALNHRRVIVSLLPGATEIVCALGLRESLVGRSHECDFPPGVEALPVCSRPRLDPSASAASIDGAVRSLVSQGLSVFEVDADQLQALHPDAIVTQIQCEVCAVSEDDVRTAVADWLDARPKVISTNASNMSGVFADIRRVGRMLGVSDAADELNAALSERLDVLRLAAASVDERPSVACIEWVTPMMTSGNWMPELIELAGGQSLLARTGEHSPWIEWDEIRAANPQVLIVSPCGFDLGRATAEVDEMRALPGWDELDAVRAGRVYAVDGHQYFHRPGPRLVDSAEMLMHIIHPELEGKPPFEARNAYAQVSP